MLHIYKLARGTAINLKYARFTGRIPWIGYSAIAVFRQTSNLLHTGGRYSPPFFLYADYENPFVAVNYSKHLPKFAENQTSYVSFYLQAKTECIPVDCKLTCFSVHGIFRAATGAGPPFLLPEGSSRLRTGAYLESWKIYRLSHQGTLEMNLSIDLCLSFLLSYHLTWF